MKRLLLHGMLLLSGVFGSGEVKSACDLYECLGLPSKAYRKDVTIRYFTLLDKNGFRDDFDVWFAAKALVDTKFKDLYDELDLHWFEQNDCKVSDLFLIYYVDKNSNILNYLDISKIKAIQELANKDLWKGLFQTNEKALDLFEEFKDISAKWISRWILDWLYYKKIKSPSR